MLAQITAISVFKMVIMIAFGFIFTKTGLITPAVNDGVTKVLMNVFCPLAMLCSFVREFDPAQARSLLIMLGLSFVFFVVMIFLAKVTIKDTVPDYETIRMTFAYSNAGFFGIPLMQSIFGSDGVLYESMFMMMFMSFVWSHGLMLMSGVKKMTKAALMKIILSPNIIAAFIGLVIFVCSIKIPDVIFSPINSLGNCMTPVCMVVSGHIIAMADFKKVLRDKRVYIYTALRLLILPLFSVALALAFSGHVERTVLVCFVMASACPVGAMIPIFCNACGKDSNLASGLFGFSTLVCLATLPAIAALYEALSAML